MSRRGVINLDKDQRFALARLYDPVNAKGLWFDKEYIPRSLEKLIDWQLIVKCGEDQQSVGFTITETGKDIHRAYNQ